MLSWLCVWFGHNQVLTKSYVMENWDISGVTGCCFCLVQIGDISGTFQPNRNGRCIGAVLSRDYALPFA